jgi:hypothetical protein
MRDEGGAREGHGMDERDERWTREGQEIVKRGTREGQGMDEEG